MAERRTVLRRRRWADVLVLIAAVYLFLAAVWSPLELLSGGGAREVRDAGSLIYAYAIAGVLGLGGLFVGHRVPVAGKVLVGLGGVVSLYGLTLLEPVTLLGLLSLGLPGVIMLLAAFFVGPMPTPEQEGQERRMPQP